MGLQKFKLHTASSVINCENSSLNTMATDQILDLFSLDAKRHTKEGENREEGKGLKAMLENLPELWSDEQYEQEYDLESYVKKV
jgi:TATA-binding protein-associated factor